MKRWQRSKISQSVQVFLLLKSISYTSCFNLQQFVNSLEAAHSRIIEIESNKLPTLRDGEERIYNMQFIIQLDKEIDQDELVSSLKNTLGVLTVLQF